MNQGHMAVLSIVIAMVVGAFAGLLTAPSARASTSVSLEIHPGANSYLNCGWHGQCKTPTAGIALDWQKTGDRSIYWRSYGYIGGGSGNFAFGVIVDSTGACFGTRVDISSPPSHTYRGSAHYTHSYAEEANATFYISGSTFGTWYARYLGYTVDDEIDDCPWTGEHLHQWAYWETVSSQFRNTIYPGYINAGAVTPVTNQGRYQDSANWSY